MSALSVKAAGGVIVRQAADGETEVLLIHRPRRDDWTFPKGKLEAGESDEACALREVEEETALRCALVEEVESTAHVDRKGRLKIVRYWIMLATAGDRLLLLGCRERCDRAATSSARQSIAGIARGA
jgi:8-oxo-dGTP diphosphatase